MFGTTYKEVLRMFYVCKCVELAKKYGVVDTEDGVIEYYTPEELVQFHMSGIRIDGVEFTEDAITVGVTRNLDFICFSKVLSNHVRDILKGMGDCNGWISIDVNIGTAGFSVSSVVRALSFNNSFCFLCEINGKAYMYSSVYDDYFDVSREIKHLRRVKDMWLSGTPVSTYKGNAFIRYIIFYENRKLCIELLGTSVKFTDESRDFVYKVER